MSDNKILDRIVPRQQREWDIKGALNFILGGAGSGLLVASPFAAMLGANGYAGDLCGGPMSVPMSVETALTTSIDIACQNYEPEG